MKKFINLVLVVLSLTTFNVSANNFLLVEEDLPKAAKVMSEMIQKNLEELEFEKEANFEIFFTVNSDSEVAILNVKSNDSELKNLVKEALNRLNVEDAKLFVGKVYSINVNIKRKN